MGFEVRPERGKRERRACVIISMFVNKVSASRPSRVAARRGGRSNTLVVRALNFGKKTATTTKGKEPEKKAGGLFGSFGSKPKPEPAKKSAGGLFGSVGSKPKKAAAPAKKKANGNGNGTGGGGLFGSICSKKKAGTFSIGSKAKQPPRRRRESERRGQRAPRE